MLSIRLFWKLFLACAGLSLILCLVIGAVVSSWLETQLIEHVDRRIRDAAMLARSQLGRDLPSAPNESLQQRVRQLGEDTRLRFTLIAADGKVLADSGKATVAEVNEMENHRDRPEVAGARVHGESPTRRLSATMGEPFMYFAVRNDSENGPPGVVRCAITTAQVQAQVTGLRRRMWGLVLALYLGILALAYWILGKIVEPIETLTATAASIAAGDYQHRVYVPSHDEFGLLAQTFNRLSQDLNQRMTQLGQSHERHSTVLGGMIEGVIAVDSRQRIVLANRAAGRLFEFAPAAAEGRPLLEVVRNHALDQAVNASLTNGQPQRLEVRREGSEKQITDIHVSPLPGRPCPGVVLVMHDTTELRRLESLRRDFVANVSHELKTPLTSIKACAETLRNGALADADATQRFLGRIEEESDRLHHLILDMLSLARIESGQQAFEITTVEVGASVNVCLQSHRLVADSKQLTLVADSPAEPCRVRADREALREILDNLVDNAIKYTPAGGHVTIRWRPGDGVTRIEVEDTGIGIGDEHRKRVFERFYRVDKARSRELGGTGLGLSIVKHLVQSFGGKVEVESQQGKGSRFVVELPAA
jgi:two-component system, OmpR family, phosphate regulon sensor histidine kinase PhoR